MKVITYIHFPGQAEEAINFYKECTGGEIINFSRMGESPMEIPEHLKNKVMHARLQIGETVIYLSDTFKEEDIKKGNNVALSLEVEDVSELEGLFTKLSAGGEVKMPLQDVFWGSRFGMLTDKFGIHWMVSCEIKK